MKCIFENLPQLHSRCSKRYSTEFVLLVFVKDRAGSNLDERPLYFSMSPNQAIPAEKSIRCSLLAAVGPLIILSWPEALNASRSRRACRMAIRRNACSLLALPDFPEFAQAVGYGVPGNPSHDRVLGRFNTLL